MDRTYCSLLRSRPQNSASLIQIRQTQSAFHRRAQLRRNPRADSLVAQKTAISPLRKNESSKNESITPTHSSLRRGDVLRGDNHCSCANNRKTDCAGAGGIGKKAPRAGTQEPGAATTRV